MAGFFPEVPKFPMPNFDLPKMEVPAAFRDMAEKGAAQARENYEKLKSAAEEVTDVLEDTYAKVAKGAADCGLKMLEAARVNSNAQFDYLTDLFKTRTVAEFVELSTAHARKQFDSLSAQTKDISSFVQKVATETAEPLKDTVSKAFSKAA